MHLAGLQILVIVTALCSTVVGAERDLTNELRELKSAAMLAGPKYDGKSLKLTGGQCLALGGRIEGSVIDNGIRCPRKEYSYGLAVGFKCPCICCGTTPLHVSAAIDPEIAFNRLPQASRAVYSKIARADQWKNPKVFLRLRALDFGSSGSLAPEELPDAFARFPEKAWPYGKVVALVNPGFNGEPDITEMNALANESSRILKRYGIESLVINK